MANASAFTAPVTTGHVLTAAEVNALDNGQVAALCRTGATGLTGTISLNANGHQFGIYSDDNAASSILITVGDNDFQIQENGAGKFSLTAWPKISTQSVNFVTSPKAMYAPADWSPTVHAYVDQNATPTTPGSGPQLALYLDQLPIGMVVTSVTIYLSGNAGHVGLPGTMPTLAVSHYAAGSGYTAGVSLGTATDGSANTTAYQAYHALTLSGLSYTVAQNDVLLLVFTSESGANALSSLNLYPNALVVGTTTSTRFF